MDVPKYRIVFAEPFESPLHLYERCKKIKADKKLSGYLIYTPSKNIARKYQAEHAPSGWRYMILIEGPRAKSDEFFKNGEYEKHAAEFVEKVKAMDPICIRCDGVYCEDGVHYQEETAFYYRSNAMESMHEFSKYNAYNDVHVMINRAHMDSEHWVRYLPDDRYYASLRWPGIRVLISAVDLRDIDHDRWFSYMRNMYALQTRSGKAAEESLREDATVLANIRHNIAKIYNQFSDSEKLMLELDMR